MGAPPDSQVAPLPVDLPFRLVSKTIGSGAYASIRKATPKTQSTPVIAVKFINKAHALRVGHLRPKQIELELTLHKSVSGHENVIKFIRHGSDASWIWIAMELAEGGDLFDKIEADEGVSEDVAHLYFSQLVAAIGWCHGKGVAHRDIKPENMLLSDKGNLKLADFGLATQFILPSNGARKQSHMVCGSPPYIAPEILANGLKRKADQDQAGYDPGNADVWSCAIVLFVLFAGNTPWDQPDVTESWEYKDYVKSNGRPEDELWDKVPNEALSLIRGMLRIDPAERMGLADVQKHPWFTRKNHLQSARGEITDPVALATQMLERLHIDFTKPISRERRSHNADVMDIDQPKQPAVWQKFASTQPDTPTTELTFDWEVPPRLGAHSASQPVGRDMLDVSNMAALMDKLAVEPSMSQFAPTPSVPLTVTQYARKFNDVLPAHSLARFLSMSPRGTLVTAVTTALHRLNIAISPISDLAIHALDRTVAIRVKATDDRKQPVHGNILIERVHEGVHEVRFVKAKGDPLSWRRLFKDVAILCKDVIVKRDF